MTAPLTGVVVLDLTTFLSGPYATQLMADLGAEVIKIEPPDGDPSRAIPPHFVDGDSAYYLAINRNKKSVVLDLKVEPDRERLLELIDRADLLVENFRPGVLARLNLPYDMLRARRPNLVVCSITGFGLDGPYRDRPAYDAIVQAMSGGMSLTGEQGRRPVRAGVPLGDIAAGMIATSAALAALLRARATGQGAHIDVSMLDVQISMLSYQAAYYLLAGVVSGPQGTGHVSIPTYRTFRCADDRDVMVTANTERMWQGLCASIGKQELANDPRFATNSDRLSNKEALWAELEPAFAARDSAELLATLEHAGVPVAPVNTIAQAVNDPHVRGRGLVVQLIAPDGSERCLIGAPFRFVDEQAVIPTWPPALGQHQNDLNGTQLDLAPLD